MWAMIIHLTGICCGFILSLILWLVKREGSAFINGSVRRRRVNFQITAFIGYIVVGVVGAVLHLAFLSTLLWVAVVVLCIITGMKANNGVTARYPFALRLIK